MDDEIVSSLARLKRRRQIWEKWDEEDRAFEQNYEQREDKIIYKRKVYERESYKDSCWYKFLQRDLSDLSGRDGKLFRNRFTVPYQLYRQLLEIAERWFPQKDRDVCGKETTPVFLKLLGALRILGKGCRLRYQHCFDNWYQRDDPVGFEYKTTHLIENSRTGR